MTTENARYATFSEAHFSRDVLNSSPPVLVDFWAPWCGPCRVLMPTIEELAVECDGQATVGKVNVDDNPQLAAQYGIRSIPTVLLFTEGQVVDRTVGVVPKQVLAEKLRTLVSAAASHT
jgi:thioredoxin 1